MGKKGDLLRQERKQKAVYTFTGEELQEHDRKVCREYVDRTMALAKKQAAEYDRVRLEEQQAHINSVWEENVKDLMAYFLAISCRVLIEQFHWRPAPKDRRPGRFPKIMAYATALVNETDKIMHTSGAALRAYAKETDELYGIGFRSDKVEVETSE